MDIGFASETITVSNTSIGITAGLLTNAWGTQAIIGVEGEPIRISFDGSDPTDDGIIMVAGTIFSVTGMGQLEALRMIRSGANDSTVKVQLLRRA